MTTPLGVPNLPVGALTVETLGEVLQDMSAAAMRARAGERFPDIFNLTTGGDVLDDLTPFGILSAIWAAFNSQVATSDPADIQGPEDLPGLLLDFIEELPVIGILVKFVEALGFAPEMAESFLRPIFEFLDWLWQLVGEEAEGILKPIFEFLNWLFTEYGDEVETFLQPIADFLKWLLDFIIARIDLAPFQALVEELVDALGGFVSAQQFVDVFKTIIQFFFGLFNAGDGLTATVSEFIDRLPLIGPIVSAITGKTEADGVALDLGTLSTYFRTLDKQVTEGVAGLAAAAQKLLGGIIPVGQISDTAVNLLSQGDFLTESTVEPAGGWSWESGQSRTGSGGSLKVTCTGSEQRIYCKQDIRVAAGDRLTLTGYVGTSPAYTSGSMKLSIVPWGLAGNPAVMTAGTIQNGAARTASASTFQALPQLSYTVPAGITSVQVSLAVNCNTGCNVYFDDIRLTKTGVLQQDLVTNLIDAFNAILAGTGNFLGQGWTRLQEAVNLVTTSANNAFGETEQINTVLFKDPTGGTTVVVDNLPVPAIGKGINPTAGSGAMMVRTSASAVTCNAGRNLAPSNFFDDVAIAGSGITSTPSTGTFQVSETGWYMVEICYRINVAFGTGAFRVTPVLYRNGSPYKVGSEAGFTWLGGTQVDQRYVQNSFIVYLTATQTVQAGADIAFAGGASSGLGGGAGPAENYFSISLLNKTFV